MLETLKVEVISLRKIRPRSKHLEEVLPKLIKLKINLRDLLGIPSRGL